jgi:hypothetical protein
MSSFCSNVKRPPVADNPFQILAIEQLHDQVRSALMLSKIVNDDDVRMTQLTRGRGLVPKTREQVRVAAGRQCLDGDRPANRGIVSAKYLAEAASAKFALYFISADALDHWQGETGLARRTAWLPGTVEFGRASS